MAELEATVDKLIVADPLMVIPAKPIVIPLPVMLMTPEEPVIEPEPVLTAPAVLIVRF